MGWRREAVCFPFWPWCRWQCRRRWLTGQILTQELRGDGVKVMMLIKMQQRIAKNGRGVEISFQPTPGLACRLQYAKKKRSDRTWWADELIRSEGEARIILLTALMVWGSADVVGDLFSEIRTAIEELEEDAWSWFWNSYSLAITAAGSQAEQVEEDWFSRSEHVTGRLAITMTRRLHKKASRRKVARDCFCTYDGGDVRILQVAAEWELFSEAHDEVDWAFVDRLSRLARDTPCQSAIST